MELLAAISIIAIFASISLPSIDSLFHEEAINTSAADLVSDIRLARAWALENQTYVRIVFNPNGYTSWVVQELTDTSGQPVVGEATFTITLATQNDYNENSPNWGSIIDDSYREVDSTRVLIEFSPSTPPPIFFRPDGLLVSAPNSSSGVIGTIRARFYFDELEGVEVSITPSGSIESIAYYDENY